MKILKQKSALFLCAVMMLILAIPFYGKGIKATAESKKSSLENKTLTAEYGYSAGSGNIIIKNWNPKAKYSVSISPKDAAQVSYFLGNEDQKQAQVGIKSLKKQTVKVTVKETVDKKTRKVGTCTIKFTQPLQIFLPPLDDLQIQKGQTYNIYSLLAYADKTDIKFNISDKSIATINKYGVITARKEGSTALSIQQGKTKLRIKITVTKSTASAKKTEKLNQLKAQTEALYKKAITAGNYTSWYNQYYTLAKEWNKYYDYSNWLQINGKYTISDCRQKLADYMKSRTGNSAYGASLDAVKITKLTSNQVTLQLASPVTKADMVNILRGSKKYSKNAKANYNIIVSRTDSKYSYRYIFSAEVKEGQKTITGKLISGFKYTLKPSDKYYTLKKVEKGKTYTYSVKSGQNSGTGYVFQQKTVKCS